MKCNGKEFVFHYDCIIKNNVSVVREANKKEMDNSQVQKDNVQKSITQKRTELFLLLVDNLFSQLEPKFFL